MKQFFGMLISRIRRALQARPALVMVPAILGALAVVVLFAAPTAAQAQGPSSCFEAMQLGANAQTIEFQAGSGTYTVTLPANTDVCVQSSIGVLSAFIGRPGEPYAVDNTPGLGMSANAVFTGTMAFDLASATGLSMEVTPFHTPAELTVWTGSLKTAVVAPVATPVVKTRSMAFRGPGVVTTNWKNGNEPKWGPYTAVGDYMSLRVEASLPFTMTETVVGYSPEPAKSCGTNCWSATVTAEGMWEALELKGQYWTDALMGSPSDLVMIPAPVTTTTTSPSATIGKIGLWKKASGEFFANAKCTGTPVVYDSALHFQEGTCGGARGQIAGAPAPSWVPLLIR